MQHQHIYPEQPSCAVNVQSMRHSHINSQLKGLSLCFLKIPWQVGGSTCRLLKGPLEAVEPSQVLLNPFPKDAYMIQEGSHILPKCFSKGTQQAKENSEMFPIPFPSSFLNPTYWTISYTVPIRYLRIFLYPSQAGLKAFL